MGKQFVSNPPNANSEQLPAIFHTLTDGVEPDSARAALSGLAEASKDLESALASLAEKLEYLADAWQAPSTEQGSNAIRDVQTHVNKLAVHAVEIGAVFGAYVDHVGTARARVPRPEWFDDIVRSPTPEQALWLGPLLPILENDLDQRTAEARMLMQGLTSAAFAVDAATPGFEPLPSQVTAPPPQPPHGPAGPGGGLGRVPTGRMAGIPGNPGSQGTPGTPSEQRPPVPNDPPQGVSRAQAEQLTARSSSSPISLGTTEKGVPVDPGRSSPPGGGAGVGGVPLPGGQASGAGTDRRSPSRGGPPGGGDGRGAGGAAQRAGVPGREPLAERGNRAGVGGPGALGGGRPGEDEDHEHRRATFLHADETADELFGTDELTAPPVIGGPDQH